jgi:hypothetical protein
LLAVWLPSRIIVCMLYRTARGSVGLYTLLPSLVCVLSSLLFLFSSYLAYVLTWNGSVVFLPARTWIAILPENGVLGTPSRTTRQRARVQCVKSAKHTRDAPARLPLQFYRKSTHLGLRSRQLLAPTNMCKLSGRLPPLALYRLPTPLRRVPTRSTAAATTAATTASSTCTLTTAIGHCTPECRTWQLHGIYRTVTVHRDVQCRRPRVSHLSWLSLSEGEDDDGADDLWCWIYR